MSRNCHWEREQRHVHEFTGSVRLAELNEDPHNHRFAGVSGQAIPCGSSHIHEICTNTDFYEDHFHFINTKTGPAIPVGDGRHVHFVSAMTNVEDGHFHEFIVAVLIDNPIGD
ncbi:MAG: YmaF family protein [Lachnospiraceae bacterium]